MPEANLQLVKNSSAHIPCSVPTGVESSEAVQLSYYCPESSPLLLFPPAAEASGHGQAPWSCWRRWSGWQSVQAHKGGTLDLREVPSAVGGDITLRHGIILAKSIPAKNYGVKTGQSIPEAKRQCPSLMLVPPNYGLYEECSAAFMDILRES